MIVWNELVKGTITLINELKSQANGTSRDQFINSCGEFRERVQDFIIRIGENVRELKRARPELFEVRKEVNWDKIQKLGWAFKSGFWAELYQLAWRFVSRDSDGVRTVLEEFLTFKN